MTFKFQPDSDGFLSVEAAVFQALGAASMCWDENAVFEDREAVQIGDSLLWWLARYYPNGSYDGLAKYQDE